jgi:PAS domain S-box-containing protein
MRPRILIVDASLTVRMNLGNHLQSAGCDTVLCADIPSAQEALAQESVALVILDILMPDGSGQDFLKALRQSPKTAQVPVLLLSTDQEVESLIQKMDAGAVVFIGKPYDLAEVVAQVHALTQMNGLGEAAVNVGTAPSLLGAKRLLAVDDSTTYLHELASQLREEDYVVILANSGEEALQSLATEPVDGILLDLIMPGLSGQETCKRIKQRANWRDIPLIMLTAHDDRDAMIECINAGADDYIAKSADFEVLKVRLRAHLRRKHFEDENHRIREKLVRSESEATARKQVEAERTKLDQRLRDQQFYTRSLIESNIDALMTTDPAGIITDVNKQMEALTGCTRDELIGAPFKSYFTDPTRAEAGINLVLSDKKVTDYELTARARDGKKTMVSYNATTFYDRDRTLQGVFGVARDVTERKRFEQALQETNVEMESAKSAAEKANLAKSDFLSGMSHELRSPLNAILGFAQLMATASPPPSDAQTESITQILQAGWHLLKLINEILDLSVVESGKVSLSLEPVSLSEVLSECQAMMEAQAQQRGILMTFPQFEQPSFVWADQTRLKQIVINLLSNAIKYNQPSGQLTVDYAVISSDRIRISFTDTGAGLTPEKMAQLFQPFNRLGQEGGSVTGTGIGLVVTKQLVELLGGVLGVESTVGKGSVFWFELRSTPAPVLKVAPQEHAEPKLAIKRIDAPQKILLYIEDNPANMKLVERLIERRTDIKLLKAVDGAQGIALARSSLPDVILMDINLPGISGIEALKALREDVTTAHIPVVAISANAMTRDIEVGRQLGFFSYLTKPIVVEEFMTTLDLALEQTPKNIGSPRSQEKPQA